MLQRCKVPAPPLRTSVGNHPVLLVDHSDATQAPDDLKPSQLVGIVDHHKLGGLESDAPLRVRIEPVGATATLVTELYQQAARPIPGPLACVLLAAVLSDTRSFQSPTTTDQDRRAAGVLAPLAGIGDPRTFAASMLQAYASAMARRSDLELINTDFKLFTMGEQRVGVSQIEAPSIAFVLERRTSLLAAMRAERQRLGLHTLLLMATDVSRLGTELFVVSADPATVERVFRIRLRDGSAWVPGLISRKRQVVPPLQAALR